MSIEPTLFAKKLRAIREHVGMPRPRFAEVLNIPPTTLKNYELGYRHAPASLVVALYNSGLTTLYVTYLLSEYQPVDSIQ